MPTFQTPNRWRRYNATPRAHQRRQRAREAASIAGPAPAYPPTAPLHGDWLGGCINGQTVIVRLMRDPSHRSDQWAAEIDGETVADAAGLTRLWALLHPRWCKAPSKRASATMQERWTARDELDAALAPLTEPDDEPDPELEGWYACPSCGADTDPHTEDECWYCWEAV